MSSGKSGGAHDDDGATGSLFPTGTNEKQDPPVNTHEKKPVSSASTTTMIDSFEGFGDIPSRNFNLNQTNHFPFQYDPPSTQHDDESAVYRHHQQRTPMKRARSDFHESFYEKARSNNQRSHSLSMLPDFTERVPQTMMHSYPTLERVSPAFPSTRTAGRTWSRLPSRRTVDETSAAGQQEKHPFQTTQHNDELSNRMRANAMALQQKSFEKLMHSSIKSFQDLSEYEDEDMSFTSAPAKKEDGTSNADARPHAADTAPFSDTPYESAPSAAKQEEPPAPHVGDVTQKFDCTGQGREYPQGQLQTNKQDTPCEGLVFDEFEVKYSEREHLYFIAGRGGETNRKTNQEIREQILSYTNEYIAAPAKERGRVFARKLLNRHFSHIRFVVRVSYFLRNRANGRISESKIASVKSEGHTLDSLERLEENKFVTIGREWAISNIADLLRAEAARIVTVQKRWLRQDPKHSTSGANEQEIAKNDEVEDPLNAAEISFSSSPNHKRRRITTDDNEPLPFHATSHEEESIHKAEL